MWGAALLFVLLCRTPLALRKIFGKASARNSRCRGEKHCRQVRNPAETSGGLRLWEMQQAIPQQLSQQPSWRPSLQTLNDLSAGAPPGGTGDPGGPVVAIHLVGVESRTPGRRSLSAFGSRSLINWLEVIETRFSGEMRQSLSGFNRAENVFQHYQQPMRRLTLELSIKS